MYPRVIERPNIDRFSRRSVVVDDVEAHALVFLQKLRSFLNINGMDVPNMDTWNMKWSLCKN